MDETPKAEVILPKPLETDAERRRNEILSVQEQLFQAHTDVVLAMGKFAEVHPDHDEEEDGLPHDWVEQYGEKRAREMLRIAKAAWMKSSDAPAALKNSVAVVTSIIKARSTEKAANRQLNIAVVSMTPAGEKPPELPVRDLDAIE